jgi:hypothetical protein
MSSLPRTGIRFLNMGHCCRDRLLACNGHDPSSPPVTLAIPTGHRVTLDHSLHTWGDTPRSGERTNFGRDCHPANSRLGSSCCLA